MPWILYVFFRVIFDPLKKGIHRPFGSRNTPRSFPRLEAEDLERGAFELGDQFFSGEPAVN